MKFAHEFKEALLREGFPIYWVEAALPYSQLKKLLKKVSNELQALGLDPATLAQFNHDPDQKPRYGRRGSEEGVITYKYDFEGDQKEFRPKLTLFLEDGLAVNATLSPDTRVFLEDLVSKQRGSSLLSSITDGQNDSDTTVAPESLGVSGDDSSSVQGSRVRQVEVNLTFDTEFFDLIHGNVTNLDKIQAIEQEAIANRIHELSTQLVSLAHPPVRFHKSDMYQWRELFNIYLEASVFFSTREVDTGSRSGTQAGIQLDWFQKEVVERGIIARFKLPTSRQALDQFVGINITLLLNLKYQELQQKAIGKITKKFEKRTKLGATKSLPRVIKLDSTMAGNMAKAICAQLHQDLVKLTPQLDDYTCPICYTIAYRPIRLQCQHVLCIRCTVLMQRKNTKACPICRDPVVMLANTDNIDKELQIFQKQYFPRETRQKKIDIETADGIEQFGQLYKHPSESKCAVM